MVMGSLGIAQGIYLHADPMLDTWLTQTSGLYARIYQDIEDMHDGIRCPRGVAVKERSLYPCMLG